MFRGLLRALAPGFALLLLLTSGSLAQQAETRFAFVIGNDGYEQGATPTAANDAALVADALRLAGFDVTGARNLDQDTLRASYREFLAKVGAAGPGAVAAVYISGHGVQFEGENYLVPVGAALARESDIGLHAIRLSDLTRPLAGQKGRANIVMFDLAYESPVSKLGQGMAPGLSLMEAEPGMLLSFNAAPGMYAPLPKLPYGPYAQAISEMIRVGNLSTDEMMDRVRLRVVDLTRNQQVPWHQSRITPPLTLLERGTDAPAPQVSQDKIDRLQTGSIKDLGPKDGYAAAVKRDRLEDYRDYAEAYPDTREAKRARAMMAARREALIWSQTTVRHTPAAYYTYLKQYPRGPHATDARRRLARLSQPVALPPTFDEVDYGVPPPPPEEAMYFESRVPVYFDDSEPVAVEVVEVYAPPPRWWAPPPPPVFDDEDDYYLAAPVVAAPVPPWVAPPVYVAEPVMPYARQGSVGDTLRAAAPYVAIPAALAAGIAAGKFLSRKRDRAIAPGGAMPPGGIRPPGVNVPGAPNIATAPPGARPPRVMPPVTLPPGQTHTAPGTRVNAPGGIIRQPGTGQPGSAIPPVGTRPPGTITTAPITTAPPTALPGAGQIPRPTTAPSTTLPSVTPPATTGRPPAPATSVPGAPPTGTPPPVAGRPNGPPPTVPPAAATGRPPRPVTTTPPAATEAQRQRAQEAAQRQQQQRAAEQARQQQLQQQRAIQQQRQQQQRAVQQQQMQQRALQQQRQQQMMQQRQQQMQQQRVIQQQQRQQQMQQQRVIQQQQRQQQMQQQRQQQMMQQRAIQQQQMQQQRQQQMMQQRQQQMMQQRQQRQPPQQQQRRCGLPGLPPCR